jgi:hypothetical protein
MAYILIDGYNLIGVAHKDLEKARNDLIQKLCKYSSLKGHNITLVFDGWKSGHTAETKLRIGNVNIIYSRLGEKADFVIKKILSEGTKSWIVVSSDREIADFATKKDHVSITAGEFEGKLYSILYTSEQEKTEESLKYEEDIDLMHARQKGNPRKLSKKQKKKLRALKKL